MNNDQNEKRDREGFFRRMAVTHINRESERRFYFIMTIAVLLYGIIVKSGIFSG